MISTNAHSANRTAVRRPSLLEWLVERLQSRADRCQSVASDGVEYTAQTRSEFVAPEIRDGGANPMRWIRLS